MMKINAEKQNVKEWLEVLASAKAGKGIWSGAYKRIAVPSRCRASVNLYKLDKYTKEGDTVIVPGKVLSVGRMSHSISIAALEYSAQALAKLRASNCSIMSIGDIVKQKGVHLII
ncbi:MAG: 50S ribosomal protein L18e [Candidatus Micrarchaeia archaeon]